MNALGIAHGEKVRGSFAREAIGWSTTKEPLTRMVCMAAIEC